jgi:hypothetical protein
MRSQAWQAKRHQHESSDAFPPLSVESHPSDRAFEMLELLIKSSWKLADKANPILAELLHKTLRWTQDCSEWYLDLKNENQELKTKTMSPELEAANTELLVLREQIAALKSNLAQTQEKLKFFETQLSAFGAKPRRIREQDVPLDAVCSKARAVITSLRAAIDRRDCSIIALKAQLETDHGSRVPAAAGTLVAQRFQHSKLRALIQAWFAESGSATVIRRLTWRKESKLKAIAWQGWIRLLHFGDHLRHQLLYDVGSLRNDESRKIVPKVDVQLLQWAWQKWCLSHLVDHAFISVQFQVVPLQLLPPAVSATVSWHLHCILKPGLDDSSKWNRLFREGIIDL